MKNIKLAIDLGTTTIDMSLLDATGNVIQNKSIKNRQSLYGSDVINRILTAVRDDKYLKIMKDIVIEDISKELIDMFKEADISGEDINNAIICGNTTMISILLEYNLEALGYAPFETKLKNSIHTEFKRIFGEKLGINCPLVLSGCVSAFIGGDIISGLIYLKNTYDCFKDTDVSILIDLGTNGEMVVGKHGRLYATSTACGPAFEGSLKKQGVYGSSLIDAISLGIRTGNISEAGILKDAYIEKGINISGIHIYAEMLRDIMSANAAIRTGIDFLLKESNTELSDIDNVYIAGGFGEHLNIKSAIDIGLIHFELHEKIKIVGNTSLYGAAMMISNNALIKDMDEYTEDKVLVLQLANNKEYQESLINNMCFKRA